MAGKRTGKTGFFWLFFVVLPLFSAAGLDAARAGTFLLQDTPTGISSNSENFVSTRYMRHIFATADGTLGAVVQKAGYDGQGLVLYRSVDGGLNWIPVMEVFHDARLVSDALLDSQGNLLLVCSTFLDLFTSDVTFLRLPYDKAGMTWLPGPSPSTVFPSAGLFLGSRATVTLDGKGRLWCAFRVENTASGEWIIKISYSTNGGSTWKDSGREFGTRNTSSLKCPRILAAAGGTAVVFHDTVLAQTGEERYKKWAWRDDSDGLGAGWREETIAAMHNMVLDVYGSHWSAAADLFGNIHLVYQDNGISYASYDHAAGTWGSPRKISKTGIYPGVTAADNGDLYIFQNLPLDKGQALIGKRYDFSARAWSPWVALSGKVYEGKIRMCVPERCGAFLPVLYQINATAPYELLYDLIATGG